MPLSVSSYNLNSPAPVAPFAIPTQPPSLISKRVRPSYWLNLISLASTCGWNITSEELFEIFKRLVPSSAKTKSAPPASKVMSAAASTVKLFADIVRSVPSPSIFSPSSPNVKPTFAGMLISVVAVKLRS